MLFAINLSGLLDSIRTYINDFGIANGLLILFFIFGHYAIWTLYKRNIKGKQEEINRIAAENREYRERFTKLIDDKLLN